MASIPPLELTHGQLLWAIALGREPGPEVRDKARYLRQLGVPRPAGTGPGKGQRVVYDFDDLALVGFGLLALGEGYRPRVLVEHLVTRRASMVEVIRTIWTELDDDYVTGPWVTLRGQGAIVLDEPYYLRLHGRARGVMAGIDIVRGQGDAASPLITPFELIPGEAPAKLFQVDYWLPQWVAWARKAPEQPRGRQIIDT